ncbi:phage tail length tape measure family protein [Mesorhizobium sp. M0862]|uniref:phage tail length tape measure family protein n=1 Tax=Mesorhizobium sp. M0862 TaxID=2957015 RepID=UPI0033354C79
MTDQVLITELTIDARPAEAGSAAYVKAMAKAEAAQAKFVDQEQAATKAMEKQGVVMTMMSGSVSSTAKSWDRLKASVDPAFAATKQMERAMITADAAARKLGIDEVERARVLDLVRQKTDAVSASTRAGVSHIASVGTAAKLTSNQMLNLSRQGNDVITMFALGAPPMQIFASQAGQIFDALESGPAGALGSLKAIGAGLLNFVATPLGGIVTAAGLAAGAIATYALATREDIKSADEVLKNHKALIDEIAKAYPAAAAAAKKYEDQASQMPKSVIAADTADNVADAQKTLATLMNDARRQMDLLNTGDGDFSRIGQAGMARFAELSKELKAGALDAAGLQDELGKIRLDPTLSKNAHDFAKAMLDGANGINKAVEVAGLIPANKAIKDIAVDGHKAVQTLADVAAGFKNADSTAGSADATIAKLFGTVNSGGSDGFGVTRSLGGSLQGVVGQFEQAGQAIQRMRREQAQSMLDLTKQFRDTTTQVETLKEAVDTAGSSENIQAFFGDVRNIDGANAALGNTVGILNRLFDALNTGNAKASDVASGVDLLRQTLIQGGLGVDHVNAFIDSWVRARMQLDAAKGAVHQIGAAVNALRDKTITVTVVTRQVGTGTQSTYDVPKSSGGGTTGVGVTRYSSNGPAVSSTPIFNTSTNSWGYTQPKTYQDPRVLAQVAAMYPQRAAGGPISANSPYWVGERGPELVVPKSAATVIPNAQSMALANPQSAYTGQVATRETDRMWQLFMNIEANTRKTYEGVEKWAATSSYSGGGSSSSVSGGSSASGGSNLDDKARQYRKVLATWNSNFAAAGIVGSGNIGYGAQGLGATPEQIARRIVYGMATGGIIGGDSRDTQKVEFFKRPSERVIIADNDQIDDQRGGSSRSGGGSNRPVQVNVNVKVEGGTTISKDSIAEMRRQMALAGADMQRSINGR